LVSTAASAMGVRLAAAPEVEDVKIAYTYMLFDRYSEDKVFARMSSDLKLCFYSSCDEGIGNMVYGLLLFHPTFLRVEILLLIHGVGEAVMMR